MSSARAELMSLFSTPLFRVPFPDPGRLNERLLEEIINLQRGESGQKRSNRRGWHSNYDFLKSPGEGVAILRRFILDAVMAAERAIASGPVPASVAISLQGWANVNPTGAYNAPHKHPNYAWSGTYYVQQPIVEVGHSGMIEFLDPRTDVTGWAGPTPRGGPWSTSKLRLRPSSGDLIIFPSFLMHWVYPNDDPLDRVSVAFNARFEPA